MKTPLIGITCDYSTKQTYSKYPWYALRENYISSIVKHNAVVLPLHYEFEDAKSIVNKLDGLIITGGDFDISPALYQDNKKHEKTSLNTKRTNGELELLSNAVNKNIPILGICGGMQLINVFFKGTLIQHIDDYIKTTIKHEQENPRNQAGHSVTVKENTKLYNAIGKQKEIKVNSAHHQAVLKEGKGLKVNAYAKEDGVIEGIEHESLKFCVAVQYHPEFEITKVDTMLLKEFVKVCGE